MEEEIIIQNFATKFIFNPKTHKQQITGKTEDIPQVIRYYRSSILPQINKKIPTLQNKDLLKDIFKIYPNPTFGTVYIKESDFSYPLQVKVIDILGKIVLRKDLSRNDEIDLEFLQRGIYMLMIQEKSGTIHSRKIIKQ